MFWENNIIYFLLFQNQFVILPRIPQGMQTYLLFSLTITTARKSNNYKGAAP